ncbi:unnamed protein product [Cylicocyclus nassatus]|uniref:Uncharacterized protein n=1 Tax=Cylicocyclus nassatus TaxID=53992 RepID=A0AA36GV29_CYLNA|nr:unnamed protein product [Cylicocyclus nassatus]
MAQEKTIKKGFLRKYIWEGQYLDESRTSPELSQDADFLDIALTKYRKYVALLIPVVVMQTFWWLTAIRHDWLSLYLTHWQLPVVMILGAMVAGMTSEGGGAVAFPVMTIGLKIAPHVARDFSLIIQSIGMSCALFVIIFMNVQIERRAVIFGTIGSVPGFVFGSVAIDSYLTPPQKKMLFVSIWSSFAIALWMLNGRLHRKTYLTIPAFTTWKALVLICTGFVGGIFTAFTGSGVDICIFSIITLLFRVTEKTATPTTVVLMGLNSVIGVYYRSVWVGDISPLALNYIKCSVPVAVTLAPLGSFLGSHFHRKVLATFIYILETLAVIGFLFTRPPPQLVLIGACIIAVGFVFFTLITKAGAKIMEGVEESRKNVTDKDVMLGVQEV